MRFFSMVNVFILYFMQNIKFDFLLFSVCQHPESRKVSGQKKESEMKMVLGERKERMQVKRESRTNVCS